VLYGIVIYNINKN